MNPSSLLTTAHEAMNIAAELVRRTTPGSPIAKGDRDMATAVDFAVEHAVRNYLRETTPDIGFLGEEEGAAGAPRELIWTLDPVDGTANLLHGLPLCAISLGLVERGRPVLGVIEHPFLGARYWAVEGQGAFANGHRIQASRTASLREAIVSLGDYAVGTDAERKNQLRLAVTKHLAAAVLRVRMLGAAAVDLAWLAQGRLDASITLSNKPWDFAAGVVLAREAGAHVVARDGSPHTLDSASVVAVAAPLVGDILDLLRQAEAELATQEPVATKRL